ncbi:uncharacterized protein LOC129589905 [Paramacrobiotus metropolitanus]|uniref:uncharacterized protein LOC129589905 n=1 Tax=Paramacrobiotus metropolitanus TaxID=2943436 RepID=UPI002445EDDC|nr:uncharacterized protein LOC129589905 [Paramacrobiotus metropolitanus]
MASLHFSLFFLVVVIGVLIHNGLVAGQITPRTTARTTARTTGNPADTQLIEKAKRDCKGDMAAQAVTELLKRTEQTLAQLHKVLRKTGSEHQLRKSLDCLERNGLVATSRVRGKKVYNVVRKNTY